MDGVDTSLWPAAVKMVTRSPSLPWTTRRAPCKVEAARDPVWIWRTRSAAVSTRRALDLFPRARSTIEDGLSTS